MDQTINQFCVCLQGKKGIFIRGKKFFISLFYQLPDGQFMVQVQNEDKLTVQAKATRFLLPESR